MRKGMGFELGRGSVGSSCCCCCRCYCCCCWISTGNAVNKHVDTIQFESSPVDSSLCSVCVLCVCLCAACRLHFEWHSIEFYSIRIEYSLCMATHSPWASFGQWPTNNAKCIFDVPDNNNNNRNRTNKFKGTTRCVIAFIKMNAISCESLHFFYTLTAGISAVYWFISTIYIHIYLYPFPSVPDIDNI